MKKIVIKIVFIVFALAILSYFAKLPKEKQWHIRGKPPTPVARQTAENAPEENIYPDDFDENPLNIYSKMALKDFEAVIKINPTHYECFRNIDYIYALEKKWDGNIPLNRAPNTFSIHSK